MKLASVFQDHMVLQRDKPLTIWGWSKPGDRLSISLSKDQAFAQADDEGAWCAILPAQPASGPWPLIISGGSEQRILQDVWIGDVWLASGQSNMGMKLAACQNANEDIDAATFPGIRIFTTEQRVKLEKTSDAGGQWSVCHPDTAGAYSAVAYFFARELHQQLDVAIGIIESSWGGSVAEAWVSREGLQAEPELIRYVTQLDNQRLPQTQVLSNLCPSIPKDPGNQGVTEGWHLTECDDRAWPEMDLPTHWQAAGHPFNGVFWFRRSIDVPPSWEGCDLELHIGACDKSDATYFNGDFVGGMGPEDREDAWSIPRMYRIPGHKVRPGKQCIAVRVFSDIYRGGMTGPADAMRVVALLNDSQQELPLQGPWRYRIEHNFGKTHTAPLPGTYGEHYRDTPTGLFNGMIAPHCPYTLRGFIWYQGESNVERANEYRCLFPALIRNWRNVFGQGELPFYFVQLANFHKRQETPVESEWAELREAQRQTLLNTSFCGMAVTIDIGDADDIHPTNKKDVGRRLAMCALARDYGFPEFPKGSPMPLTIRHRSSNVVIRFADVGDSLQVRNGSALQGFSIAGEDRRFISTKANITSADTVTLDIGHVHNPCWVRYAWADNPEAPLYGSHGLPACPFEAPLPYGPWLSDA